VTRQLAFFVSVISLFFISVAFCFSQSTHIQVVPETVKSGTFEVNKGLGKVPVQARELLVRIELRSRKAETLDVSMLYDPVTKLFWWRTDSVAAVPRNPDIPVSLLPNSVICLTDSKFVTFWDGNRSGRAIFIFESTEHYSSMDEGQSHLIRVFEDRRGDIDSDKFIEEYKRILIKGLDDDFLFVKNVANRIGPTLRDVKRVGNEWQVVEDGPNGGSALIMLNDNYEVIKTTLMPSKGAKGY
jgi:hypothetical protein